MDNSKETPKVSRREFIKKGSSLAAASGLVSLAAPAILSSRSPNGRISLGFLGTGSRACEILRSITGYPETFVTDVCDIYPPNLEEGAKLSLNDKVRKHEKWEKVLEQKDVDAVVVATPLYLHVPMSVAALEAGKHVYSEKSMGRTMKECNEMLAAAQKHSDLVYLVGYQSRLNESLKVTKDLVKQGSFGKITQFYVHFDRNQTWKRVDVGPEWDRQLNWRLYSEYCDGLLTEVVTHEIDMVMEVLGTLPVSASFYGKILVYQDGRENHDSVMGTWEMEDGVLGVGTAHLSNASQGVGWSLLGTHGTVASSGGGLKLYWEKEARHLDSLGIKHKFTQVQLGQSLKESESPNSTPAKVLTFKVDNDYDLNTGRAFKHFYDCILNGTKPVMDAVSCRNTSIAALMAYHSSINGGRLFTRQEIEAMG